MEVADVYDALISKRVYKTAFSHEEATSMIKDGAGKHFDPMVVEIFLRLEKYVKAIAEQLPNRQKEAGEEN